MRNFLCVCFLCFAASSSLQAAPGAVRCGKLLDVKTGQLLTDQVIVFDEPHSRRLMFASLPAQCARLCAYSVDHHYSPGSSAQFDIDLHRLTFSEKGLQSLHNP